MTQPCRQATNNAISRRKEQRVLPSNEKPLVILVDFYYMSICSNLKIKMDLKNKILNKQNRFENKIQITNICIKLQMKTKRKSE